MPRPAQSWDEIIRLRDGGREQPAAGGGQCARRRLHPTLLATPQIRLGFRTTDATVSKLGRAREVPRRTG
jgi:hypothetical protein